MEIFFALLPICTVRTNALKNESRKRIYAEKEDIKGDFSQKAVNYQGFGETIAILDFFDVTHDRNP